MGRLLQLGMDGWVDQCRVEGRWRHGQMEGQSPEGSIERTRGP